MTTSTTKTMATFRYAGRALHRQRTDHAVVLGEPFNDGDADQNTNLSLDFGVVPAPVTTLTLGNLVWNDLNNNGTVDSGEPGVNGVSVQLFNAQGTLLQTTTTAGGGLYCSAVSHLAITAFEFQRRNSRWASRLTASQQPDHRHRSRQQHRRHDDGAVTGVIGSGGYIETGVITLSLECETDRRW